MGKRVKLYFRTHNRTFYRLKASHQVLNQFLSKNWEEIKSKYESKSRSKGSVVVYSFNREEFLKLQKEVKTKGNSITVFVNSTSTPLVELKLRIKITKTLSDESTI